MKSLFFLTIQHSFHSANPQLLAKPQSGERVLFFLAQPQSYPFAQVKLKIKPSINSRYPFSLIFFFPIMPKGPEPTDFVRVGLMFSNTISTNPSVGTFDPNISNQCSTVFYHQGKNTPIRVKPIIRLISSCIFSFSFFFYF